MRVLFLCALCLAGAVQSLAQEVPPTQRTDTSAQKVYFTPSGVARSLQVVSLVPLRVDEEASGAFLIKAVGDGNRPVAYAPVQVTPLSPGIRVDAGTRTTDPNGMASFGDLQMYGPPGPVRLRFSAGEAILDTIVELLPGPPLWATVVEDLPVRILADSIIPTTSVRVTDAAGNHLPQVRVRAQPVPLAAADTLSAATYIRCMSLPNLQGGRVQGALEIVTDDDGIAHYSGLRYSGKGAEFRLAYCAEGLLLGWSGGTSYDPDAEFDRSYVVVSSVKTLSGEAPPGEFFDLRLRLRMGRSFAVAGNFDLSLTRRAEGDSGAESVQVPTDGTGQLHWMFHRPYTDRLNAVPQRVMSGGGAMKVVRGIPYWGVHATLTELGGSPFHGSSVSVGWANRWVGDLQVVEGDSIRPATDNLYADFFIRSTRIEFFRFLTIRGSFFLPMTGNDRRLQSRIAVAVPIGDVNSF